MNDHTIEIAVDGWKLIQRRCPRCEGRYRVYYRIREDSEGHEDEQYKCFSCGHKWWVEGPDY